jgi:hypothetical protein
MPMINECDIHILGAVYPFCLKHFRLCVYLGGYVSS